MHVEGAQAILANTVLSNTAQDMTLVWNDNLKLYGVILGGHVEYIQPDELKDMGEVEFRAAVTDRLKRYHDSLIGHPDFFYIN